MDHSHTKPTTEWLKGLPLNQMAKAIYNEQCRYIGRDHEGESVKLILAGLEEAKRQGNDEQCAPRAKDQS